MIASLFFLLIKSPPVDQRFSEVSGKTSLLASFDSGIEVCERDRDRVNKDGITVNKNKVL